MQRSTLTTSVLYMTLNNLLLSLYWILHLNNIFMLNWIVWNRIILTLKLRTSADLKTLEIKLFWRLNCVLMLNWIICNKTVWHLSLCIAKSTGAVEYTDCISAGYDTKQSGGDGPALQELWGIRSTPSLPALPSPLWLGVVAPDRALSMG